MLLSLIGRRETGATAASSEGFANPPALSGPHALAVEEGQVETIPPDHGKPKAAEVARSLKVRPWMSRS